jgi:hypothetical protein
VVDSRRWGLAGRSRSLGDVSLGLNLALTSPFIPSFCFLSSIRWVCSALCSHHHDVLARINGAKGYELKPLKLWAKQSSPFKLFLSGISHKWRVMNGNFYNAKSHWRVEGSGCVWVSSCLNHIVSNSGFLWHFLITFLLPAKVELQILNLPFCQKRARKQSKIYITVVFKALDMKVMEDSDPWEMRKVRLPYVACFIAWETFQATMQGEKKPRQRIS